MLRFRTLRKLDATVLDALIAPRRCSMILPGTAAAAAGRDAGVRPHSALRVTSLPAGAAVQHLPSARHRGGGRERPNLTT